MRPIFFRSPRPKAIHDHWRIYNAPHPIHGKVSWESKLLPGQFYTAQPPEDDETALIALNAARVFYLSEEQICAVVIRLLRQEDPDEAEETIRCCEEGDYWRDELERLMAGKTADEVEMILQKVMA